MSFDINKKDVTDNPADGQVVTINFSPTGATGTVDTIKTSPEWNEKEWGTHRATISARGLAGKLDALLFHKGTDGSLSRVEGSNPDGNSLYVIKEPEDLKRVAANLGIAPEAINKIGYQQGARGVENLGVTFRDGVETAAHHNSFILALEAQGLLARGTAFKMAEAGLTDSGQITVCASRGQYTEQLDSFEFGPAHNKTGHAFRIRRSDDDGCEIIFGKDAMTETGSVYRWTSGDEFNAAQKIAAALDVGTIGKGGIHPIGVGIKTRRSFDDVAHGLAQAGLINKDAAKAIAEISEEFVIQQFATPRQRQRPSPRP